MLHTFTYNFISCPVHDINFFQQHQTLANEKRAAARLIALFGKGGDDGEYSRRLYRRKLRSFAFVFRKIDTIKHGRKKSEDSLTSLGPA